jgi:nucleoside-diphosphate-sugar epimerase
MEATEMKVLITGASGVLGRAVTGLLEREEAVRLVLTDVAPLETRHEFRAADLTNLEQWKPLCEGVDTLMHIAAIHPWNDEINQRTVLRP